LPKPKQTCKIIHAGRIDYDEALRMQMELLAEVQADPGKSFLILLTHDPVYTLGRNGDRANVLITDERLEEIGAKVVRIHRGGDVTYHGPGQIVGYPILSLTRHGLHIRGYFDKLETVLTNVLKRYNIEGHSVEEFPGVWVGREKIAAIGVGIKRWITFHGFALNANTDMSYFSHIIPCGIRGKAVTSMQKILAETVNEESLVKHIAEEFLREFGMRDVSNCAG